MNKKVGIGLYSLDTAFYAYVAYLITGLQVIISKCLAQQGICYFAIINLYTKPFLLVYLRCNK